MKIIFFIESLRSGGKERRLVELFKGLQNYPDIECELVLTRKDIHYMDIFDTGIKIHYIVRKQIKKDPRLFFLFYKICKKYKPDIIHVWGNMVAIYAIPTKLLLKIPMINNEITDAPLIVRGGLLSHKATFPFSDKIIANTYAGLKSYKAPKEKSIVIYNGFNFERIGSIRNPEIIRNFFKIRTKYVIAMVAKFSNRKDYHTYISAANLILENRNDITFLCIGAGDDKPYKSIVTPDNKDKIRFLGCQSNVEEIINICDIGVLTSNIRTHGEGISNALLEFSALKKPILGTNNGGTPEIIINGENGFLLSPNNDHELAKRINYLLDNKEIKYNMGLKAYNIAKTKFSNQSMFNSFINTYKLFNKK